MKKLIKKIKHLAISIFFTVIEKTYSSNETLLKYLFYKGSGDALIVSFSAYNNEKALLKKKYINKIAALEQYIYLQYSDNEYTYDSQIKYLIEDLKKN